MLSRNAELINPQDMRCLSEYVLYFQKGCQALIVSEYKVGNHYCYCDNMVTCELQFIHIVGGALH